MAAIYVIHAPADRAFVTTTLLRPLPSLGFDSWLAATRANIPTASRCGAVLVVVSDAARRSRLVQQLSKRVLGLRRHPTVIPIRVDDTPFEAIAAGLPFLPSIDLAGLPGRAAGDRTSALRARLLELLPPVPIDGPRRGELIAWDEESFSEYLQQAIGRHDHSRGAALLDALQRHLRSRKPPYPIPHARFDLDVMRKKRQFQLMERYAVLVRASGTEDWRVDRQLGQALIERGAFRQALAVLRRIVKTAPKTHRESYEARGLIGRAFKQQYVNRPKAPGAERVLRRAYDAYAGVHDAAPGELWHGINAVSLMLRADRDALPWRDPASAKARAAAILDRIAGQARVPVWDRATRVEALVALGRFAEADAALTEYLADRDMDAFEVSSTFRQFDEVLQLGGDGPGHGLHQRLFAAADRFRAGGAALLSAAPAHPAAGSEDLRPIIVRVSDPGWRPPQRPDLFLDGRIGTVISGRATPDAIRALLKDPVAIAIEESWPAAETQSLECAHGLPCVHVQGQYADGGGPFEEQGAEALVAFVDNGIDVLHEAFRDGNGQTRIEAIWDQRDTTPGATQPSGMSYGRLYTGVEIQAFVTAPTTMPAALKNPCWNDGNGKTHPGHGTHVASIAAGSPTTQFFGGIARAARLIHVIVKPDGDIGYSKAHLDALAFIAATAKGRPVVVNVSMGMNGGAHDGQSALEVAFNEFSNGGRLPGRVIVKSSGNQRADGKHACFAAGQPETLTWTRPLGGTVNDTERIELWWSSANDLTFSLVDPGGTASAAVSDGAPDLSDTLGTTHFSIQLIKRHVDNGDSLLRIELGRNRSGVAPGTWALLVTPARIATDTTVHAWISTGRGPASRFTSFVDDGMTLTIPGTAHSVITVGAMEVAAPNTPPSFSSRGPTRDGRQKPDVAAPGVAVFAAKSDSAIEALDESGTSMAAPFVTGAIALVLSRAAARKRPLPSANQVRAALIQKAQRGGPMLVFDPWKGYGVLDVAALLAAF